MEPSSVHTSYIQPGSSSLGQTPATDLSITRQTRASELNQTTSRFDRLVEETQGMAVTLFTENERLNRALTNRQSQERQITTVLRQELRAAQQGETIAREETESLRRTMAQMALRAEATAAQIRTEQGRVLQATTEGHRAQLAALQEQLQASRLEVETVRRQLAQQAVTAQTEKEAAVLAATQRGAAALVAEEQKGIAALAKVRQETSALLAEIERQNNDTNAMEKLCEPLEDFPRHMKFMDKLRQLIRIRRERRQIVNLEANKEQQLKDTQALIDAVSDTNSRLNYHWSGSGVPERASQFRPLATALIARREQTK